MSDDILPQVVEIYLFIYCNSIAGTKPMKKEKYKKKYRIN